MEKLKYVKFWMSDWRGGVAQLMGIERALYHEICSHIWETGEGVEVGFLTRLLPDPDDAIKDAYAVLVQLGKVREEGGRIVNDRSLSMYQEGVKTRGGRRKGADETNRKKRQAANEAQPWHDDMRSTGGTYTPPQQRPRRKTRMEEVAEANERTRRELNERYDKEGY